MKYLGFIPTESFLEEGYPAKALSHMESFASKGYLLCIDPIWHLLIMENFGEFIHIFELEEYELIFAENYPNYSIMPYMDRVFTNIAVLKNLPENVQLMLVDRVITLVKPEFNDDFSELILYAFKLRKKRILNIFLPIFSDLLSNYGLGELVEESVLVDTFGGFTQKPNRADIVVISLQSSLDKGYKYISDLSSFLSEAYADDLAYDFVHELDHYFNDGKFGFLEMAKITYYPGKEVFKFVLLFKSPGKLNKIALNEIDAYGLFSLAELKAAADDFNKNNLGPFAQWMDDNLG